MRDKQVVLIVEDEEINRKILKKILSEHYTVLEASNGAEAWNAISAHRHEIAAVLLDVVMPIMNGYQLMQKISEAHLEDLPIIITTGAADDESEQYMLESGAWDYITKPYNAKILLSRLRNAIARSQLAAYETMQYMAEHDKLTGLYNRNKMFSESRRMIDSHPGTQFAFIRFDIAHFALFNTSFGEKAGNALLNFLSACIVKFAESHELCVYGRMNGDVFCACFNYDGDRDALCAKIAAMQNSLEAFRKDYLLDLAAGVCVVEDHTLDIDDFYFYASIATQNCKNQYESHIAFYDSASGKKIANELAITNDMQTALEEEQFVVYLQAKMNLANESVCGSEALVRWIHPVKGMISPGEFIPVFERNGFISKLDYYMWEHTCKILHDWIAAGKKVYPISVNISRISLYNPLLAELMTKLVEKYDIPVSLLQLEITESAYMTNPELMESTIESLHEAGFTILMDDFGSGYSSLNTLKRIKVDVLKIDMKFLPVGDETERAEIILACIIKMANWLGMTVVTEGVETREQRDFLEGAGCDCVQGYYYARPIPYTDFEKNYLTLQSEDQAACSPASDESEKIITPKHNMTILVIDDSEMEQTILKENFQHLYHVCTCDSAEAGLAYLKKNISKVKLILVDNIMPGMSGLEFLKYCQENSALSVIPKIMISANDTVEDQVAAFKAGAYDYITKPLVQEVFQARVNHVMEISRRYSVFDSIELDYKQRFERDSATNLLNKMAFNELSNRIIEHLPDDDEALFVIDIDNFKQINDKYGHLAGDKIISCVADELRGAFRKTDVVGRFGGDEFVVLMTKIIKRDVAKRKAEDIITNIFSKCMNQFNICASISIGIAFSEKNDTVDTLFARADQALYEAKNTGKGKSVVYGEIVPPVIDDNKPIILICSDDPQLYHSIALAYGSGAAFLNITTFGELEESFEKYRSRIRVICLDMQKKAETDSDDFYRYITQHGGGDAVPVIAVCREGDMEHLRAAVALDIFDLLSLPPQMDAIQRRISAAMMKNDAAVEAHKKTETADAAPPGR